jgi:nucleolar protein 15
VRADEALDAATASAAKRTKTSPAAKVVQAIKGDDAAAAIGKKGAKQARPQRQAPAAKISATSARAAEEVDVGSSDSESGSDGGAVIEGLDFSSEDDEVEVKAVAHAVGKSGKDVSEVARATRARKARTSVEADGMVAADGGPEEDRGVMYVGHLPNGFFEHEMRAYFSQFGTVTRLRVSRNKRTGASKGYAFIEFESADVCEIAAKTMDHYLLFNHILRCKVIPKEQVPEGLWKGANRRFKYAIPSAILSYRPLTWEQSRALG